MQTWKIILIALITGLAGVGAGYLFFKGKDTPGSDHTPDASKSVADEEIWTCSMHPQIRQNEPGDCPICGMELIPISGTSTSDNPLVFEMTHEAVKLAQIETMEVGVAGTSDSKSISLTGKIQADERRVSSQVAHVPGRIEDLFVTFTGEQVRQGQKLVTLYSPDLVSAQRELIEASKWKESRPQLLKAARNKLRYWKIPDTTIENIELSGEVQPRITIYVDQSGIVLKRRISIGDYVKEGGVLFDIANLNRLWVLFDAYEEDLAVIRVGDKVSFTMPSAPGQEFTARITFIDPVINPQTRVASLRAEVSNKRGLLKPEMFVKGKIYPAIKPAKTTLLVPKTAVLWTGTRSVVYLEQPDAGVPSFEFREITLGDAEGGNYVVLDGLDAGERVVVNGAFVIDAAAQLNNMASMMNRNVRQTGVEPSTTDYSDETPEEFRLQLMHIVAEYLPVKDALVSTDPVIAKTLIPGLIKSLEKVDMALVKGDAHLYWMEKLEGMKAHGEGIGGSDNVEEQRKQFSFFTDILVETLSAFGTTGDTLYLQFCPMAFDNTGADWLSNEKAIRNPYFGDKMLKCGKVIETFPIAGKPESQQENQIQFHQH